MARYGDLDALEKKLFPMGVVDDGRYALPAKSVKVAIDRLPTADVVPRTVIAEMFAEIDRAVEKAELEWGTVLGVKLCLAELRQKFEVGSE